MCPSGYKEKEVQTLSKCDLENSVLYNKIINIKWYSFHFISFHITLSHHLVVLKCKTLFLPRIWFDV